MKVAILDDYQNVSLILGNFEKLKKDFDFHVFNQPFENEEGIWTPEADDQDHPVEVLGRSWHYQNSSDLRPSILISKGI